MAGNAPESSIADGSAPYTGWPESVQATPTGGKKRRRKSRFELPEASLSINSLMDIVTIILVYLIKSFATSPIDVQDPSLEIPASSSLETVEEGAVVLVTGPVRKVYDEASGQTKYEANQPILAVDNQKLFPLVQDKAKDGSVTWRVPADQKSGGSDGYVVNVLKDELVKAKERQEILAAEINEPDFTGKVVILADKRTPYRVLMDVLVTCGQAGFGEFRFAILRSTG